MSRATKGHLQLLELKANMPSREVEGYASTWDLDDVGDQILKGAFEETLRDRHEMPLREKGRSDIRVLWQHEEPIGVLLEAREDDHGLWIKVKISNTSLGNDVLQLLADGAVDRMSIGYMVPPGAAQMVGGVRVIRKVSLWEVSFVTFPANPETSVESVKCGLKSVNHGMQLQLKAVKCSVMWTEGSREAKNMAVTWSGAGLEAKAGRVQAGRNVERLKNVMEDCKSILEKCTSMLKEAGLDDGDGDEMKAVTENPDNDYDRDDNAGGRGKPPSNHDVARDARAGKGKVTCPHCKAVLEMAGDVSPLGQPKPHPESVAELVPSLGQPEPQPESIANAYPGPYAVPTPKPESIASNGGYHNDSAGMDQGKIPPVSAPVYDTPDAEGSSEADLLALAEGRRTPGFGWSAYVSDPMPTPGNRPGGSGPYPVPTPQPYSVAGKPTPEDTKGSNMGSAHELSLIKERMRSLQATVSNL